MSLLQKALSLSADRHRGQVDKGGNPYVEHLRAVARMVETVDEQIVALLHDIVEDTDTTLEDLRSYGFSEDQVSAIGALTKRPSEAYDLYLPRVMKNDIARKVKIADITHNMDLSRLGSITNADLLRSERYRAALDLLRQRIG